MIFEIKNDNFYELESYKERNLYYKIFAGYLFNELIPDEEQRKEDFVKGLCDLVINSDKRERVKGQNGLDILNEIKKEKISVTFDYHSSQIIKEHKQSNRGEMSDILLISSKYFISIECKYLSDLDFPKDIIEVQERIVSVEEQLKRKALQVLLIKKEKWDNIKRLKKVKNSFYDRFEHLSSSVPVVILLWEDLIDEKIIKEERVINFLEKQLDRKY